MKYVNLRAFTTASMVGNEEKNCGLFDIQGALKKIQENPEEYSNTFAVTEKNNMYSVIDFYKAGQNNEDFNALIGIHLNFAKQHEKQYEVKENNNVRVETIEEAETYPVLLIAKNNNGYQHICKLQTLFFKSKKEDRVTEQVAKENKHLFEDLFVLSGGNGEYLYNKFLHIKNHPNETEKTLDELKQHINFWKEISNNNYFIELQRDGTPFENDYIKFILPIAIELKVPVVATNNTYFLNKSDFGEHQLLNSNSQKQKLLSNRNFDGSLTNKNVHIPTPENYFKSNSEMTELFKDIPVALSNSVFIAENSKVTFELNKHNYLPEIQSPNLNENIDEFFRRLANEGLDEIMLKFLSQYGVKNNSLNMPDNEYFRGFKEWQDLDINPDFLSKQEQLDLIKPTKLYKKYKERLDNEIDIIINMKFPSYFLVVSDFIKWAKDNDIPVGPGRGSGAGSLVAYALKITHVDPLQFGLLFERFLNPERVSMPDFDIDFSALDKSKVEDYVRRKYSTQDKLAVSKIMAVSKYATLASIEVAASCYGIKNNHPFVKEIKEYFDTKKQMDDFIDDPENSEEEEELGDFFEIVENNKKFQLTYHNSPLFKKILDLAEKIHGNMRTASVHAAGVVIASQSIDDILPLTKAKDGWVTQLNKDNAEGLGVIKFDFLSLENLNVLQHAISEVNKKRQKSNLPDLSMDDLNNIDIYDQNVYKNIFQTGNTTDVFQFASSGMKQMLINCQPDCFEDLIALVSLYRPGPMDILPDFIATKHGKKPVVDIAPSTPELKNALSETYGFFLYQEQIMIAAMLKAGYSLGEADILRRAMGKKKPEEMAKQRGKFLTGSLRHFNLPENVLNQLENFVSAENYDNVKKLTKDLTESNIGLNKTIVEQSVEAMSMFDQMEKFAGYGFNKSHAAAYAFVAYQTAWMKYYYPNEYALAVLHSHVRTKKPKETVLYETIMDTKRNNVDVLDLDINQSHENFHLNERGQIIMPFLAMSGWNTQTAKMIQNLREKHKFNMDEKGHIFKNIPDFLEASFNNNTPISEKALVELVKVGAFNGLANKESNNFYIQNAKEILNYFAAKKPKISSPLLKFLPNSMIKSSAIKKQNKPIEFKTVSPVIPLEEQLLDISKILKFIPNNQLLKELAIKKTKLMSLFTGADNNDDEINMGQITNSFSGVKKQLGFKLDAAKNKYYQEFENNKYTKYTKDTKVNTFGVNSNDLIHAFVLDTYESKYSTFVKVVTEDGVFEIESKLSNFKKNTLEKFKSYYFLVNSRLNRNYDPLNDKSDLVVDFNLQDYFTNGDLFSQATHSVNVDFNTKLDDIEDASAKLKDILIVHKEESKSEKNKSDDDLEEENKIELPVFLTLPNNEMVEVYLDSTLLDKIKENNLKLDVSFNYDLLNEHNQIITSKLNGNLTDHVNVDQMLDKIYENNVFKQINKYAILTNTAVLEKSEKPNNGEHLIFGYIQKFVRPKQKSASLFCVDSLGNEFKISDKENVLSSNLKHIKTNEPVILKTAYIRLKDGGHFYTLKDFYFEKEIKQLKLLGEQYYINKTHEQKFIHDAIDFNPTIVSYDDALKDKDGQYKYVGLDVMDKNPTKPSFIANQFIRLDANGNQENLKALLKEYDAEPLFPFKQKDLSARNFPNVYDNPNNSFEIVKNYNEIMDKNYKYNFTYIENKGTSRFTDIFIKAEQLNHYEIDSHNQNGQVMTCMIPKEISNTNYLTLVDDTGSISLKLSKEAEVFDFQSAINNQEPLIFKIKPSKSSRANDNRIFLNLSDVYTMEDGLKYLGMKMFVQSNNPDTYKILEEIIKRPEFALQKNVKTMEIGVVLNNNIQKDQSPLIVQYSDKLYDTIKEELGLSEKQIYIKLNHNIGEVNEHYFPDKLKFKFIEANKLGRTKVNSNNGNDNQETTVNNKKLKKSF